MTLRSPRIQATFNIVTLSFPVIGLLFSSFTAVVMIMCILTCRMKIMKNTSEQERRRLYRLSHVTQRSQMMKLLPPPRVYVSCGLCVLILTFKSPKKNSLTAGATHRTQRRPGNRLRKCLGSAIVHACFGCHSSVWKQTNIRRECYWKTLMRRIGVQELALHACGV